ncbi:hypothetical protein RRG08_061603 [Elysia crispata]|uniref:Uncharacterized protein n=1 Tax=Elysia crispata TaxID=231223 RepID=A0AAE0YT05_9GAST|nr:hypothetical protein RRG08_061603 [Elysia crispata]
MVDWACKIIQSTSTNVKGVTTQDFEDKLTRVPSGLDLRGRLYLTYRRYSGHVEVIERPGFMYQFYQADPVCPVGVNTRESPVQHSSLSDTTLGPVITSSFSSVGDLPRY